MARQTTVGTLGATIRRRRQELGWSQEVLADRVSALGGRMRQSDVSRLEHGRVGLPHPDRLERLATVLGMPVGELLARSGWAGADRAFGAWGDAAAPETEAPPAAADRGRRARPADPVRPPHLAVEVASASLREAIGRARRTRTRTVEILERSAALEAAYPRGRPAVAAEDGGLG